MRSEWFKLFARELADKWQIPTFTLAVLLGTFAIYHLLAHQERKSTDDYIQTCHRLIENKYYDKAGQLGLELLKGEDITSDQRKQIHGILAQVIYDTERPLERHDPKRLGQFFRYFNSATSDRHLTVGEHLMLVDVYRWENKYANAVDHLYSVLDTNPSNRPVILRQIIELLPRTGKGNAGEEYSQRLDELLSHRDLADQDLVWATDLKTELLFKDGQFHRAVELLGKTLPRVKDEKSRLQLSYSQALGQYYQGQNDLAEPVLRDILDRLDARSELEAKVSLLVGRICQKDDRPEEAGAFFDQVIDGYAFTDYHLAAVVGKAEVEAKLHRFASSRSLYQEAFELLDRLGPNKLVSREGIVSSMEGVSQELAKGDQVPEALSFSRLAYGYLDPEDNLGRQSLLARIAAWHRQWADKLARRVTKIELPELADQLRKESRENYLSSAERLEELSRVPGLLDRNASQILWQAAQCYELGGSSEKSKEVLEAFVKNWPFDPHLPEAMFKLARMNQSQNRLVEAEEYYRRLITEYTRTPFGQQSLTLLAECYLAMGPQHYDKAERILRDMVDDTSNQKQFRPESSEFRSAVFLLGKLYYAKQEYEQCVGRLEEALERYPNDREGLEARFLIAQSYRSIAEKTGQLVDQTSDRQLKVTLGQSRQENLHRARDLYYEAALAFEKVNNRTRQEETYLQMAYMYSADCLYDLFLYDQAVKAYEKVIERYEKTPMALDSYVQIINAYQRLGQHGKIKAVLERMKWLLRQIPDEALARPGNPTPRRDWEEWIDWNYRSGLLDQAPPNYLAQSPNTSGT